MRCSKIPGLALLLVACAAEVGPMRGSPADVDAGANDAGELRGLAQRALSSLSASELTVTCEQAFMRYESGLSDALRARQRCLQRVVWLSLDSDGRLDVAACDDRLERCLAGEAFPEPGPMDPGVTFPVLRCEEPIRDQLAGCSSNVADFEGCITALTALVNEVGFTSCNSVAGFHIGTNPMELPSPAACDALRVQCGFAL